MAIKTVFTGGDNIVVITDFNTYKPANRVEIDLRNGVYKAEIPSMFAGTMVVKNAYNPNIINIIPEIIYNTKLRLISCIKEPYSTEDVDSSYEIGFEYIGENKKEILILRIFDDPEDKEFEWVIKSLRPDLDSLRFYTHNKTIEFDNTPFWHLNGFHYYKIEKCMIMDKVKKMGLNGV